MKKFFAKIGMALTATTVGALAMAITTTSAHAWSYDEMLYSGLTDIKLLDTPVFNPALPLTAPLSAPVLSKDASIAVARLDGGRMIPTPYGEQEDWTFLDRRIDAKISQLGAGNYIKYIPEIPFHGQDTMNKIDEIRLTAANEGHDFVLIYGVGPDAGGASFGKRTLSETGLKISSDCGSWKDAKAKALLVDSFTGEVLGAVTANEIDYNIGQLADRVGDLIQDLSA